MKRTMYIDCEPGMPRPDVYAKVIFQNILKRPYQEDNCRLFGCWTWENVEMTEKERKEAFKYLEKEYYEDNIRYARIS